MDDILEIAYRSALDDVESLTIGEDERIGRIGALFFYQKERCTLWVKWCCH